MAANPIEVTGAVKRYGRVRALDNLELCVRAGQVHGFLGPNGSGKSTTLRLLLGLIRADGGRVRLLGGDPWRDAVPLHARVSYVPGDVALWPHLTGGEAIDVLTGLRGHRRLARRDDLIERFALDPSRKCRTYSKGNRQKMALVAAFAPESELLLLDEPTTGLDPLMEEVFAHCVVEAQGRGATVLLSSHILAEVERLCSHVTIVRAGRRVRTGALAELRRHSGTVVTAHTRVPAALEARWCAWRGPTGCRVQLDVPDGELDEALRRLTRAGIESLECRPASLSEIFLEHYETAGP